MATLTISLLSLICPSFEAGAAREFKKALQIRRTNDGPGQKRDAKEGALKDMTHMSHQLIMKEKNTL